MGVCDAIVNFEHVAIPQRREAEIAERYNGNSVRSSKIDPAPPKSNDVNKSAKVTQEESRRCPATQISLRNLRNLNRFGRA
jgi:hypothetical protein